MKSKIGIVSVLTTITLCATTFVTAGSVQNGQFGPTTPQIGRDYILQWKQFVTLPGMTNGVLTQEVENRFLVEINQANPSSTDKDGSITGNIRWQERRILTTVGGTAAKPDVLNWTDADHQTSFTATFATSAQITTLELSNNLGALREGIVAFLSGTLFPVSPAGPNGSVSIPDPLAEKMPSGISPKMVVLLPVGKDVLESTKEKNAHLRMEVEFAESSTFVRHLQAVQEQQNDGSIIREIDIRMEDK